MESGHVPKFVGGDENRLFPARGAAAGTYLTTVDRRMYIRKRSSHRVHSVDRRNRVSHPRLDSASPIFIALRLVFDHHLLTFPRRPVYR